MTTRAPVRPRGDYIGGVLAVRPRAGDPDVAHVSVRPRRRPLTDAELAGWMIDMRGAGWRGIVTAALNPGEQAPFRRAGFEVMDELHLLTRALGADRAPLPLDSGRGSRAAVTVTGLRRGRRRDHPAVLACDERAFEPTWHLDRAGLADALTATPAARFRGGRGP